MTDGSDLFLGVIAVSTAMMALVQIGAIIYGGRLVRRMETILRQVQEEIRPVSANLSAFSRDAARAASLAASQVERADKLFAEFAERIDETISIVQGAIVAPLREGVAVIAGLKAVLAALRELREPARRRGVEDDDALFI